MHRTTKEMNKAKRQCRELFEQKCVFCMLPTVSVAHIYPTGSYPQHKAKLCNMVLACEACHTMARVSFDRYIGEDNQNHHRTPSQRVAYLHDKAIWKRDVILSNLEELCTYSAA